MTDCFWQEGLQIMRGLGIEFSEKQHPTAFAESSTEATSHALELDRFQQIFQIYVCLLVYESIS